MVTRIEYEEDPAYNALLKVESLQQSGAFEGVPRVYIDGKLRDLRAVRQKQLDIKRAEVIYTVRSSEENNQVPGEIIELELRTYQTTDK